MKIRIVTLNRGPFDGCKSIASHETAIHAGEVYVWDGGNNRDLFTHAESAVYALSDGQFAEELKRVNGWMHAPGTPVPSHPDIKIPAPMSMLIGIPPWRINAWMQLIKTGAL